MSVLVKICGITNVDDALDAVELGADFLGFNFYPDSLRYVDPDLAREIIDDIPGAIQKVGVFVNADPAYVINLAVDLQLDILQFHGDETPEYCNEFGRPWWKAFRLKDETELSQIKLYESSVFVVDSFVEKAFGGTGVVSNWDLSIQAKQYGQLVLSGGLKPDNIELAVRTVRPYAVDVASGIELSPGIKDRHKMEEFILRAKGVMS